MPKTLKSKNYIPTPEEQDLAKVKDLLINLVKTKLQKEPYGLCMFMQSHGGDSTTNFHIMAFKDGKVIELMDGEGEQEISRLKLEQLPIKDLLDFIQTPDISIKNINFLDTLLEDYSYEEFVPEVKSIFENSLIQESNNKKVTGLIRKSRQNKML